MPEQYKSDCDFIVSRLESLSFEMGSLGKRWAEQLTYLQERANRAEDPLAILKCIEVVFEMQVDSYGMQVEKMAVLIEQLRLADQKGKISTL